MTKNPRIAGKQKTVYSRRKAKNCPHTTAERQKTDQITKCKTARSRTQAKNPKNFNSSLQLCLQKIILIRSQYDKKLKFLGSNRKLKGFRFFVGSFLRSFFALVFCGSFKAVSSVGLVVGMGLREFRDGG